MKKFFILVSTILYFYAGLYSQKIYQVDTIYPVHALDGFIMVLEDSSKSVSLEQLKSDTSLVFWPLDFFPPKLNPQSAYWAKISIQAKQSLEDWYLQMDDRQYGAGSWIKGNGKVDIYALSRGNLIWHKKTGKDYSIELKNVKKRWNLDRILLDLEAGKIIDVYIRIEGNRAGFPPFFNLTLRKPGFQYHHPFFTPYAFINTVLFGILFISLIYHLLLLVYLREEIFLWFSLWLFFSFVTIMMGVGFGFISEFLIKGFPKYQLETWLISANSVWFIFWFFGRSFIRTKDKFPVLDKIILGLCFIILAELLLTIFKMVYTEDYMQTGTPGLHYVALSIFCLIGFFIAIWLTFQQDPLARYFGLGAMFATAAPVLGGLWVQGIIRLPFNPFITGIILQVIAYSFGLAYRQQLKQKAFQKAQKELLSAEKEKMEIQRIKDLNEVKSRFFSNVSHEFRTPLSLILGPLRRLKKPDSSSPTNIDENNYNTILRNAHRLQHLVDQLLDLSSLENGQLMVNLERGSIKGILNDLISDFSNIASERNITFDYQLPAENVAVYFDQDKLEKVLNNLLSNAFKYTPAKGRVDFKAEMAPYHNLIFTISDTGKGIDESEIGNIFQRFYRIEGNEAKGSGIGLALSKELIERLGGTIKVQSTKGRGTTFILNIPGDVKKIKQPYQIKSNTIAFNQQKENVDQAIVQEEDPNQAVALIVEDNEDMRQFITEILSTDYRILSAENGVIGEEMAIHNIPNIIISDVMMPKRNGFEMCERLKSNIKTSHIPILMLTAKAGQKNKISGLRTGADAYMTKPFDAQELLLRVQNLIHAREALWNQFRSMIPTISNDTKLESMDNQFYRKVNDCILQNLSNEAFSVEELATSVGFSKSQLHRKLKAIANKTPNKIIREHRLQKAKQLLENRSMTVSETAYAVGYPNLSYFSKIFKETFGCLPSEIE